MTGPGDSIQKSLQMVTHTDDDVEVLPVDRDGGICQSRKRVVIASEEKMTDFELHDGIEFESHEVAYSFYQEYAKSMGFTTSIKNSRRSKKSKEFIDAKFACSRYGVTPEAEGCSSSSRRPTVKKTDCKASMHVKRKRDGNCLCERAIELGEVGSLSEESYNIAFRVLDEALKNCVNVNNRTGIGCSSNIAVIRDVDEENQGSHGTRTTKKKSVTKKRKVQSEPELAIVDTHDGMHQDNLTSDDMTLSGYYGAQQNVQGLIQLNLMERPNDAYYVSPQNIQGLGQLTSIAPGHDGFFGSQQCMPMLGHLDYRPRFGYSLQDEPNTTSAQLHCDNISHT
ncbi:hypothetical protein DM860_011247 [Cuscuta australis]|uniref:FAR1 domain-containing protein n=1 Tax=Cuscuta australis TaxID=267555 RepID=A0A328DSZ2_9ASTE|nr:hypothetical protein DM860_011247 [Cuscuta australis]